MRISPPSGSIALGVVAPVGTIDAMNPTDAAAHAALEAQFRQLARALEKLLSVRVRLVPVRATFWRGRARDAYNQSLRDLDGEIGSAIELIRMAHRGTRLAIAEVEGRG